MNTQQHKKSVSGEGPETPAAGREARQIRQDHYTSDPNLKERRALWWLERDFLLLPAQPNSKKLVEGFGPYQEKISNPERVRQWFSDRSLANLAVCGTQTSLILDFDDPDLYQDWAGKFPAAARTYTEQTPRGGYHVFAHVWGESLKGFIPIQGVELKRVVLVSPSTIGQKQYTQGAGEMLKLEAEIILSPLCQAPIINRATRTESMRKGRLQQIKSAFSCLDLLQQKPRSACRFVTVNCPFHEDKEPSFWIDTDRNLWGCHACNTRGDVINLFARLKGITNAEAIREMGAAI